MKMSITLSKFTFLVRKQNFTRLNQSKVFHLCFNSNLFRQLLINYYFHMISIVYFTIIQDYTKLIRLTYSLNSISHKLHWIILKGTHLIQAQNLETKSYSFIIDPNTRVK